MKRFNKIYLEISNLCNLRCAFCPGTKRSPGRLTPETMAVILPKLRPYTDFLYFHLMGEPLCHPELGTFLSMAGENGFKVIITTNGSLLAKRKSDLLSAPALHKINISLHAFEANDLDIPFQTYLEDCFNFGKEAEGKKLVVFRLWNNGGADTRNQEILETMEAFFPKPWVAERKGTRIGNHIFLEYGDKFEWPDLQAAERSGKFFCYGLRDQIGILCDGTVVPCCLDHEGDIPLGNILAEDLSDILCASRARAIYDGFSNGCAAEMLCRKCGYAKRFH